MPSTAFLAGSRVTLILIRFFQKMENNSPYPDRLFEVLSLCQQVEEAVHEWNIVCYCFGTLLCFLDPFLADTKLVRLATELQSTDHRRLVPF
jgi:hypothetical protein